MPTRVLRPLLAWLAVAAVLGLTWFALRLSTAEPVGAAMPTVAQHAAAPRAAFRLLDHRGREVTERDLRGAFTLVYFGYTSCPSVCPTTLTDIAVAMESLEPDGPEVRALFVTVDPARDTPATLATYVEAFHPRLVGLTGSEAQIRDAARSFRAHYRTAGDVEDADYLVDHSAFVYLIGPDGRMLTYFPHGTSAKAMTAEVRARVAGNR